MKIARIFLIIPAPSWEGAEGNDLPPPTPKLTHWRGMREGGGGGRSRSVTWRRGVSRQFYWDTHRRQTWTSSVVPDASQHWLYKPSRQEMAVSVVHWCSVTGQLLWRSLKQPSVPLSGILQEKRPCTARSRVVVWNHRRRDPLVCGSKAHQDSSWQKPSGSASEPFSLLCIYPVLSKTQSP